MSAEERRRIPPGTITWRVVASVMGSILILGGTAWITKTDTKIEALERSQSETGREVTAIKTAVNSLMVTTDARLGQLENNFAMLAREVSALNATIKAAGETQNQLMLSIRELRDDLKVLIREKSK